MSSQSPEPDIRLGKYQVLAHIATGGMGSVYKARDTELGRIVALKILDKDSAARPTSLERFRREARHAARLSHKNIVTLFDCGKEGDTYYLALEYVPGTDLAAYLEKRGRLPPEEARRILIQAAKALDHAFQMGIVHRDIKPSNFLLTHQDKRLVVKLTDMGLARTVDENEFRVTRAGSTVGTVDYLSPEQARDSRAADVRSDIYSLGCTLYHMLAGSPPFSEGGLGERIYKHLEAEPEDVRQFNPRVSLEFWGLLRRMLAKRPEERYQTPAELLHELKHVRVEASSPPTPISLPAAPPPPPLPRPVGKTPPSTLAPPPASTPSSPALATASGSSVNVPSASSGDPLHTAARQFERASQALTTENYEYAIQLLLSCCKIDPGNVIYRQALRQAGKAAVGQKTGARWLRSLTNLAGRSKIKSAMRAGQHRKVLEHGEEVLARNPDDIRTQMDMAEAAEALGLIEMAVWILEHASQEAPQNADVLRHLARLYAQQCQYSRAIAVWEQVRKVDPKDSDAQRQINALAARDTIARGNYKRP